MPTRPVNLRSRSPSTCPDPGLPLTRLDLLFMVSGFAVCISFSVLLGRGRIFWEDEMLGWMLLTDPSFHHMVSAWKLGADGGGFTFYLTARAWLHLFGASALAFRMYSAVCFGLAFVLIWAIMRRFYAPWIVAFALFNTFFCSSPIVLHLVEGRFYGLLMLSVSLALWLALHVRDRPDSLAPQYLFYTFLAHALLTTSHLLGVVYSAFLILILVALDRLDGRSRPLLYLSAALSWLLLLPELPAIRASAQVGKPWFWLTQPPITRFVGVFTAFSGEIALVLLVLFLALAFTLWRAPQPWRAALSRAFHLRRPAYLITAALLAVPLAFLLEGYVGPPLFINRYLMPVAIATAFMTAEAATLIDWRVLTPRCLRTLRPAPILARFAIAALLVAVIIFWDLHHLPGQIMAQKDYTGQLTAILPRDLPVLTEDAWAFTEIIGRQHNSGVRFLYPLDWDQTVSPHAPRLEVTQYNLMKNWQRAGYFSGSIVDLRDFLARNATFLVLDSEVMRDLPIAPILGNPLARRFAHTPGYQVKRWSAINRNGMITTAWIVTHDPSTTGLPIPMGAPGLP